MIRINNDILYTRVKFDQEFSANVLKFKLTNVSV